MRYYIQQGLLPSPGQFGPGAKYSAGHLDRLKLIRQLQRAHLPLAEIRHRLQPLGDDAVAASLARAAASAAASLAPAATGAGSSAVDYVRAILGTDPPASSAVGQASTHPPRRVASERSQWERVRIDDDVELHVRRPLSLEQNRRVEKLLEAARRVFEEEP